MWRSGKLVWSAVTLDVTLGHAQWGGENIHNSKLFIHPPRTRYGGGGAAYKPIKMVVWLGSVSSAIQLATLEYIHAMATKNHKMSIISRFSTFYRELFLKLGKSPFLYALSVLHTCFPQKILSKPLLARTHAWTAATEATALEISRNPILLFAWRLTPSFGFRPKYLTSRGVDKSVRPSQNVFFLWCLFLLLYALY